MPTPASVKALENLRDLSTLQWYVIPLLAIVLYIYATEIKKARSSGNWNAVFAGLTVFGMDFINETWNGWVFHLSQRSACWTAPGDTALRTMIGWNIEIMFMLPLPASSSTTPCLKIELIRFPACPTGGFRRLAIPSSACLSNVC